MSDGVLVPSALAHPNKAGEVTLVNPSTGESVVLSDASDDQLGAFMDAIDDWQSRAKEAKALAGGEITRRMDKAASWTIRTEHWTFKGRSPAPSTFYSEPQKLSERLMALAAAGEISEEAAAAGVEVATVTTYSPKHGKLVAISKASEKAARLIKRHTVHAAPQSRSVKVEPRR